jgi:TBC1 domain family member 5
MQDYHFFREPAIQKKLLDILFIYSKLNPDMGYRQGMHELLAPLLWVVYCDAIEPSTGLPTSRDENAMALMVNTLDAAFVEHDTFNLFCAIMQTMKTFYEVGDPKSSPVAIRSRRVQEELLKIVDPELSDHLESIEILPQIYLMSVSCVRQLIVFDS